MATPDHHLSPEAKSPKPTGLKKTSCLSGRGAGEVTQAWAAAPAQPTQGRGGGRVWLAPLWGHRPQDTPTVRLALWHLGLWQGHTLERGERGVAPTERGSSYRPPVLARVALGTQSPGGEGRPGR